MDRFVPARSSACVFAVLALLAALAAAGPAGAGQGWHLVVREWAVSPGDKVLLGDIAEVQGEAPPGTWERLAGMELWRNAEKPGKLVTVSRDQLAKLLRHYAPEAAPLCLLPNQITIQHGGTVSRGPELQRMAVAFLTPQARNMGGEPDFQDFVMPDSVFAADGETVGIALQGDMKPGRIPFQIHVTGADGRILRKVACSVFVGLWKAVPCASRPINRGEEISPDMVTLERRNVSYLTDPWDGTGGPWRVAKAVGTGQPILRLNIEPMPAVAKGSTVELVYRSGKVNVSVKAQALSDGRVGQTVSVRNMQSKKIIAATVVDRQTVVVR